ncbi:EscU/YscU/HrcU family type III secretion system export apparatus switch protein [Rhodopirellula sp. JC639]|uniref:EscU/YscU/HrcU family type III secretion system export apparatus switch protein n=1 Tax=Stieleria mannarensis TaxID=2755585 RepID=UPI001600230C|nr:EscU/YscU/HrcU family type III secretion system export apparatus switch protein [Rhodopirellula sp. JC639]
MSEKIHPPTPRRRKQAKEQGRAPRSSDVVSAGSLLVMTCLLSWFGPGLAQSLTASLTDSFSQPVALSMDTWESQRQILKAFAAAGTMLLPMLVAMLMCGVALNLLQTGVMMTPSKLAPSLDRISPGARLQSMTSARSLGRFAITLLKLIAVSAVAIGVVRYSLPALIGVTQLPMAAIATTIFDTLIGCCFWMGATLLALASVDYALARWQHERDLMMTEQELREEMRDAQRAAPAASARTQAVQGVA